MNSDENFITIESENEGPQDFFFDTYAFYEIIKENPNYKDYINTGVITTKLNIFELYLAFLKDKNVDLAEYSLRKYYTFAGDFDEQVIREAAKLKIQLNNRDVSMTDCIGYCFAKQLGIKFLTGDNAFEKMRSEEH